MESKKENIYFYTMINEEKGIKSSDICYGVDYDSESNLFKTILEHEDLVFAIDGEIEHDETSIAFNTIDNKAVKLRYINLPLYDSLKGYLINYNSPNLSTDKEVQDYFKSKSKNLR